MTPTLSFTDFAKQKSLDPNLPATDAAYKAYLKTLPNYAATQKTPALPAAGQAEPVKSLKSLIDVNGLLKQFLPQTDNGIPIDYTRVSRSNAPVVTELPHTEVLPKDQYAKKLGVGLDYPGLDTSYELYVKNATAKDFGNAGAYKGDSQFKNTLNNPVNQAGLIQNTKGVDYGQKGTPLAPEEYALVNGDKDINSPVFKQRYQEYLSLFAKPQSPVKSSGLATAEPPAPKDEAKESTSIPVAGPLPEEKPKKGLWDTIMDTINTGPVHDIIGLLQNAVEHRTASLQNRRVNFDEDTIIGRDRVQKLKEAEQARQYDWQRQLQELNQQFLANQAASGQEFQSGEAEKQRKAAAALQAQSDRAALERTLANRKGESAGLPRDPLGVRQLGAMK